MVFHVQTEDSGVDNPHIFTHLFHGGVILSTRKLTYDPAAAEDVVKSLMQAQHKAALKELKNGTFAEKIESYLGDNPDLEPRAGATKKVKRKRGSDISEALDALAPGEGSDAEAEDEPASVHSPAPSLAPKPPGESAPRVGTYAQHRKSNPKISSNTDHVHLTESPTPAKHQPPPRTQAVPKPVPAAPSGRRRAQRPSAGGVVVSRPAVIVGAPPKVVGSPKAPRPARARKAREESQDGIFGQDLISEKSLDEVILAYLSEDGAEE